MGKTVRTQHVKNGLLFLGMETLNLTHAADPHSGTSVYRVFAALGLSFN